MEHFELLFWLQSTDFETIEPAPTLELVRAAARALQEMPDEEFEEFGPGEEMLSALEELLEPLEHGELPREQLLEFRHRFEGVTPSVEPVQASLERELRELAASLAEEQWCTESYLSVEQGVDSYLDEGDEEPLLEAVERMAGVLEQAYRPYREATIVSSEVTAESYVGHLLLGEGIEQWMIALELLRQDDETDDDGDDGDWSQALSHAETGNRLLVAVQLFNARLQAGR